ncbi:unnamed protein product, partial [Iphiclides podalirius]
MIEELSWWLDNIDQSSPIYYPTPTVFITTVRYCSPTLVGCVADKGWGAIANGQHLWGLWAPRQQKWHSNQKELWTVYEVLSRLGPKIQGKSLMLQTDNRTSVAYVMKQGGTKSLILLQTVTKILELCRKLRCHITARYIPGQYNGIADGLSRARALPEWHLNKIALKAILQELGYPEIDLFASKNSAIVPAYVSEDATDEKSQFTDAFSRTWRYQLGWIFPPPALIPQVLRHLKLSEGHYLLVTPTWSRAFWEPEVRRRAMGSPFRIRNLQSNLVDLRTNQPPPEVDKLNLVVWKVQGGQAN